jgi:hypothetical protein
MSEGRIGYFRYQGAARPIATLAKMAHHKTKCSIVKFHHLFMTVLRKVLKKGVRLFFGKLSITSFVVWFSCFLAQAIKKLIEMKLRD